MKEKGVVSRIYWRNYMRANVAMRYGMVYLLSGRLPLYIVNEYPKSGGSWVGQLLARALDVPYPRNRFPILSRSIMHGHYLSPRGLKNVVLVWRDGRDVMVSAYYHSLFRYDDTLANLFKNDLKTISLIQALHDDAVAALRKDLLFDDYENVRENLPAFIEYTFTKQRSPRFSWATFVRRWLNREGVVYVRYEDLLQGTVCELQRVFLELTGQRLDSGTASVVVDELSFARQSGRQQGQENKGSFLRKGIAGDWRHSFSREAREVFDRFAGDELVLLGYEPDRQWVHRDG